MTTKPLKTHLISSIALIVFCVATNGRAFCATSVSTDKCDEAGSLVLNLGSANHKKQEKAKESILVFASRSPGSRQCVIRAMLKIVNEVNATRGKGFLLAAKHPKRYAEWIQATDILGTMKATEALDALIASLDYNNGATDFGIGHFPATKAIVKFGDQVIPNLETALKEKPPSIRVMAAQALRAIGGEKARLILVKALENETDKYVADTIRDMLLSWHAATPEQHTIQSQQSAFRKH
jgi:hypothetical protein